MTNYFLNCTQEQIATLFGKGGSTITLHIGNVFKEGELERRSGMSEFPTSHSTPISYLGCTTFHDKWLVVNE